jgi:hypothetical protein
MSFNSRKERCREHAVEALRIPPQKKMVGVAGFEPAKSLPPKGSALDQTRLHPDGGESGIRTHGTD